MTHDPAREARDARGRAAVVGARWLLAATCALFAGCGGGDRDAAPLEFVEVPDSSAASRGAPILTRLEPYRMDNGAVRVRGRIDLPDRTRLQLTLRRRDTQEIVGRVHVFIEDEQFDSPPILGPAGPLPRARYHVEALALFNDVWQEPRVMRATDGGRRVRGIGVTRDQAGAPAYRVVVERDL